MLGLADDDTQCANSEQSVSKIQNICIFYRLGCNSMFATNQAGIVKHSRCGKHGVRVVFSISASGKQNEGSSTSWQSINICK